MAHQKPPVSAINPRSIPVPSDPELKAAYLALGWKEFPGIFDDTPYLKWPFDLRSPMHPGEKPDAPYVPRPLLADLPVQMIDMARSELPLADQCDGKEIEALVLVAVKFKKRVVGGKRRSGPYYGWIADSATMKHVTKEE